MSVLRQSIFYPTITRRFPPRWITADKAVANRLLIADNGRPYLALSLLK